MLDLVSDMPGVTDGRRILFDELARLAKPEVELTVSEFADRYRVVSPESGSPFPGPWKTDRVPYLREPMDCLHPDNPARRVTVKASAQVRYKRVNGVMAKGDRQTIRALEKIRANLHKASKEART